MIRFKRLVLLWGTSLLCACSLSPAAPHNASSQAYCKAPGTAPSGVLSATRIKAANTDKPSLYEGPVWLNGALYFTQFFFTEGFPARVWRLAKDHSMRVAINNSGSNGLAVDGQGRLLAATHKYKGISRFNLASGSRETIVQTYAGHVFDSPNDLTESRTGELYFTDPDFQKAAAPGGQPKTRVYRVADGKVSVVDDSISNPNGISLSPDEKTLYVSGGGEHGFVRAYHLTQGKPGPGRQFLGSVTVPDGMAVDCLGNLYVTEHTQKRIRVVNPKGKQIATIKLDSKVTNAAFGGPEHKTLFITGAGALWSLKLGVAGMPY